MKNIFFIPVFALCVSFTFSQEVIKVQNGARLIVQNGTNFVLQGGITLENGSSLSNHGILFLKNNPVANTSDWKDFSLSGSLSGTGIVIFNSTHSQQFTGLTNFYTVVINTNELLLNNNLNISNILRLINGKINTGSYLVFLNNTLASSLETDATNATYSNSWINGTIKRLIATNTSTYDFPVGNSVKSNLLKFINNNITGPSFLTSSFGTKHGTDAGLNVTENGNVYTAVNNGGVWYLVPNTIATNGNYALHLYFNGFTGLTDNNFGILRRPDASSNGADWNIPGGSLLEPINGLGRKVSDGFARRLNISDFSQLGIGQFKSDPSACSITGGATVCIGSTGNLYSGPDNMSSYSWIISGNGSIVGSPTGSMVNVTAGAAGSFTLTLNATAIDGSTSQCTKTVIVIPGTACSITGAETVNVGSNGNTYSGPASMSSYSWIISGNGSIVGSPSGQSVSVTAGAAGSYTLSLTTALNGCISTCSKTVTVMPATCTITGTTEVCSGSSGNTYSGPANMSSYSWIISGNGSIVGSPTGQSVTVTAGATGNFVLALTAAANNGAISQCTKTVTVSALNPCSINGPATTLPGSSGNIYSAPANMSSYSWLLTGNGAIIGPPTGQSVNIIAGATGTFTLTLTTTLNGCIGTCNQTVIVSPITPPNCTVNGSAEVCAGSTGNSYSGPSNMSSYFWIVSGNGSIIGATTGSSVNITAGSAGNLYLTLLTSLNGIPCSYTKTIVVNDCATACTYTQGFYGNVKGKACYNNTGLAMNSSQLMLNAFGVTTARVFGNVSNKRFFTLFKSDITSGAIYKMLPGGGPAKPIDVDIILPYNGAYYSDQNTWYLVPLQPNGPQKGKIRNSLLAQTMTLWFNLGNSSSLGAISLLEDTLVTKALAGCGSNIPVGDGVKFGLPHDIIVYLNGNNGYPATVNGLFELANDVLGGVNTVISLSDISNAADVINNAFDECRVLVGTLPYIDQSLLKTDQLIVKTIESKQPAETSDLKVVAYPNPYKNHFQLLITSPVSGMAHIEFFTLSGQKVYEINKPVAANVNTAVTYTGPLRFATLIYKVTIQRNIAKGIVLKPN